MKADVLPMNETAVRQPPVCQAAHKQPIRMTDPELCATINAWWAAHGIKANARIETVMQKSCVSQCWLPRTAIVSDLRGTEKPGRAGELGT